MDWMYLESKEWDVSNVNDGLLSDGMGGGEGAC